MAVVLVVLYHGGMGVSGGFVGVDVFFVISGFVIAKSLVAELSASGTVDLKRFYVRRARRLLPALAAMLAVVMVAARFFAPVGGQQWTARTGLAAAIFNANTYLASLESGYFTAALELNALLHTWSLSVEEQFYFAFPLGLLGAWRIAGKFAPRYRLLAVGAILASIGSLSLIYTLYTVYLSGRGASAVFYFAPARAWEFLAGVLLAVAAPMITRLPRGLSLPAAIGGITLLGWSALAFDGLTIFPGIAVTVPVTGAGLLVVAGDINTDNAVSRAFAWRPLQFLGDLSYSWYLWHWPLIVFAAAWWPGTPTAPMVAALASLGPAYLSYRFLEEPIRHAEPKHRFATAQLVALSVLVPVVAALSLSAVERSPAQDELFAHFAPHPDLALGCDDPRPMGDRPDVAECTWGVPVEGTIVLIGDSQAGQLIEGVIAGTDTDRYSVTAASYSSCPFVDLIVTPVRVDDLACRGFYVETLDYLIAAAPDLAIIASGSDLYLDGAYDLYDPGESGSGRTPLVGHGERVSGWESGLSRTVASLQGAGIDVVLVHPIPKISEWDPRGCAVRLVETDPVRCGGHVDVDDAMAAVSDARMVEAAVAERYDLVTLDLFAGLCGPELCSAWSDGGWQYRDGLHISVSASMELGEEFAGVARLVSDFG